MGTLDSTTEALGCETGKSLLGGPGIIVGMVLELGSADTEIEGVGVASRLVRVLTNVTVTGAVGRPTMLVGEFGSSVFESSSSESPISSRSGLLSTEMASG
jgi:hypothetical protein